MPFDSFDHQRQKNGFSGDDAPRLYIAECGCIRVESRHFRRDFAPAEFVAYLRELRAGKERRALPALSGKISKSGVWGLLLAYVVAIFSACATTQPAANSANNPSELRIVSVGGAVTETVFALDEEAKLVGADTSSVYPAAAPRLPQVGYQRTLSAEGVLSLKPSLVLAAAETGPPAAIRQIESAGVKITRVNGEHTIEGAKTKIREIAAALNAEERGEELIKKLDNDLSAAKQCVESSEAKPKVLFIYARGAGAANIAGVKTAGDAIITLAGGRNAVTEFEGFKPLTPESLVASQPDVILLPKLGLDSLGGIEGLLQLPGIIETPAGKNRRIITIDDLVLLGFGPRLGEGIKELCEKLRR